MCVERGEIINVTKRANFTAQINARQLLHPLEISKHHHYQVNL